MAVPQVAPTSEVDAARRMFVEIQGLADTFEAFLRKNGDLYELGVFLEHWEAIGEQQARLDSSDLMVSDMRSIMADACIFFVELTDRIAMHADIVARNANAAAKPCRSGRGGGAAR